MKVLYDPEHDACAVEIEEGIISIVDGAIFIQCAGKPEYEERQLLTEIDLY
jgi:hypothetical protein